MKIKKVSGTAVLNGNVVDSLEDNSTINAPSQRAVNEEFINVKGKILWTNPSPTSEMIADTLINLSSDDYDIILWIYALSINNIDVDFSNFCMKGHRVLFNAGGLNGITIHRRLLTYQDDKTYSVSNNLDNGTENNGYNIPLYAIGYKLQ